VGVYRSADPDEGGRDKSGGDCEHYPPEEPGESSSGLAGVKVTGPGQEQGQENRYSTGLRDSYGVGLCLLPVHLMAFLVGHLGGDHLGVLLVWLIR
jgi:hypothetical protein